MLMEALDIRLWNAFLQHNEAERFGVMGSCARDSLYKYANVAPTPTIWSYTIVIVPPLFVRFSQRVSPRLSSQAVPKKEDLLRSTEPSRVLQALLTKRGSFRVTACNIGLRAAHPPCLSTTNE